MLRNSWNFGDKSKLHRPNLPSSIYLRDENQMNRIALSHFDVRQTLNRVK